MLNDDFKLETVHLYKIDISEAFWIETFDNLWTTSRYEWNKHSIAM